MIENRRLRFSDISGLERGDLRLACEIWLDDLYRAPWVSQNAMKLGTLFVRYMTDAQPAMLVLNEVESHYELERPEVAGALSLMRIFGAIESFRIDQNEIRASLNLSLLQRLRTLEAKQRLNNLMRADCRQDSWQPGEARTHRNQPQSLPVMVIKQIASAGR